VQTADGQMTTFIVHADGEGPFPVAVLYMDGVGYREQVKENARRFAADGYYCVVPDLFHRSGEKLSFDFTRMGEQEYRERLSSMVSAVKPDMVIADTEALFAAIADDPAASPGPKVCVGYCIGARFALHAAAALPDEFAAAAGIHPGALVTDQPDSPHHDLALVRGELYFAFAENDPSATAGVVERFRDELEGQGVKGVVERLCGTSHAFDDGRPPRLRPRRRRTPLRAHARTLAEGTRTGDLRRDGVLRAKPGWAGTTRASRAFQPWSFGDRRAPPGACCDLARDVRGVRPP
jgi:carboxymethylenebutenolidase